MTTIDYTDPYMCTELGCDVVDVVATPSCGMPTTRVARVLEPGSSNPAISLDGPLGVNALSRIVADVKAGRHVVTQRDDVG